jgi:hypothetical protein
VDARQSKRSIESVTYSLPTTRYRGSKRRYARQIAEELSRSSPSRIIDPFAGSGVVSAIADTLGVPSRFNDLYQWTCSCARALLIHSYSHRDVFDLIRRVDEAITFADRGFVTEYFHECYFTDKENLELDGLLSGFEQIRSDRLRDLLFYGVAQASLAKMPMSMFHRASIAQRLADVPRQSGNSTTWSTPFRVLVPKFILEAALFSWQRRAHHTVTCGGALEAVSKVPAGCTLFLDPPYLNPCGRVPGYDEAYHFLEGFRVGRGIWEQWLDGSGSHPIFRGSPKSMFDTVGGWVDGIDSLLAMVDGGSVIATARLHDRPGSTTLRRLLLRRFRRVHSHLLHTSTIFTRRLNPEYLFCAS